MNDLPLEGYILTDRCDDALIWYQLSLCIIQTEFIQNTIVFSQQNTVHCFQASNEYYVSIISFD